MSRVVRCSLTFWLACTYAGYVRQVTADEVNSLGLFESHADVGVVLHPGSVQYDAAKKAYTVTASGENMWAAKDAFHYVWKKVSGDLTLSADVSFLGKGVDPHRKACLIFRQTLDAESWLVPRENPNYKMTWIKPKSIDTLPARAEHRISIDRSERSLQSPCARDFTMWTILLLVCSNAFMTMAWYGHLRFKTYPILAVILASWLIALPEYLFQVPANRIGHGRFSAPQLKIIQEVISIGAFVLFNAFYLKDRIRGTDWVAFGLIFIAVLVMMVPRVTMQIGR